MYKLCIAFRYLRRNWLNLVAVAAVAIGVVVLVCVLSVMKGFDTEFRARIRATLSDLIIESWSDDTFDGYEEIMARVERLPHVVACAPHFEGLALIRLGKLPRYGGFTGIDLEREIRATDFADYWRAWRGAQARDELEALLAADRPVPTDMERDTILASLGRLRKEDYDLLSPAARAALTAWARRNGVALGPLMTAAAAALPAWGPVLKPETESPAFAGSELLVIGKSPDGALISMGVGDQLVLVTAADIFDRTLKPLRITGEFRSGQYEYDSQNVYMPLADVQQFMGKRGRVTSINVRLESFDHAPDVRAALLGILTPQEMQEALDILRRFPAAMPRAELRRVTQKVKRLRALGPGWYADGSSLPLTLTAEIQPQIYRAVAQAIRDADEKGSDPDDVERIKAFREKAVERGRQAIGPSFRIMTWEEKRRTFLRAVWLERRIMAFILFFVILIAGFLILSILHTTVLAKTKDIGIVKSIGGTVRGIMAIFLLNGLLIGLIGSALGATGGVLITSNINRIETLLARLTGYRLFPKDIYYLDRVPVDRHPFWSVFAICVTSVGVSFLASAYPAWKAARMDPVEALRYE